jgi:hypothetical protein
MKATKRRRLVRAPGGAVRPHQRAVRLYRDLGGMAAFDPELSTRIRFPIGAVLPADSELAQYILNLARATNDILLASRRLLSGFESDAPAYEHFYDISAIASHAWELAEFLRHCDATSGTVRKFVAGLEESARTDHFNALDALSSPEPGADGRSFKVQLAIARNQAIHYSRLGAPESRKALARIADQEGELHVGEDFKDFYADFAADLDAQMFFPMRGDEEAFRQFSDRLLQIVGHLMRFSRAAIDCYLLNRQELLALEDLD